MAQILVLYPHPADPEAFDKHYFGPHADLTRKIPGLRSFVVNRGAVSTPQGEGPYHLVAQLNFDSIEALHQAMETPESQAAVADLANFAPEDTQVFIFDNHDVM